MSEAFGEGLDFTGEMLVNESNLCSQLDKEELKIEE